MWRRVRFFIFSLAGRIAVILTLSITGASYASLYVADQARRVDIERMRSERTLVGAIDVIDRLQRNPSATQQSLARGEIVGAHSLSAAVPYARFDPSLEAALAQRFPAAVAASLGRIDSHECQGVDPFKGRPHIAGFASPGPPECWLVSFNGSDGIRRHVAIELWTMPLPPNSTLNPLYLAIIVLASALLSIAVASLAMTPLKRLSMASDRFAASIDAAPIPELGPDDVRAALATFNDMQSRVRDGVRERTQLLTSISHDLQTPLTRLRLRLEQVPDEDLRGKLVGDLMVTLTMVRRSLDLARGSVVVEEWSWVDLDSLLSSLAVDGAEIGNSVTFAEGCKARVWVKPDALTRCLGNLIDNAVKYAGGAQVTCAASGKSIQIFISDDGPGISEEHLELMFKPFVRGPNVIRSQPSGTGIGLSIARAQAASFGGQLTLSNRAPGGLNAVVTIPHGHGR